MQPHTRTTQELAAALAGTPLRYARSCDEHRVDIDGNEASAFTFGYELLVDGEPAPERPVVFLFNGGPIVSSIWLHGGGIGPVRVRIPEDLDTGVAAPYVLDENPSTLLTDADLVFVDPPGTGFGRIDADADPRAFHAAAADSRVFAQIITEWLTVRGRLASPKYLLGESYGTVRAVLLAAELLEQGGSVAVNGIALLGQTVNIQDVFERPRNVAGAVAALPVQAVAAWFHGVSTTSADSLEAQARLARRFASEVYQPALLEGTTLAPDRATEVAEGLEQLTGISATHYLERRLVLTKEEFRRRVLARRGQIVGRYDARYTANWRESWPDSDPSDRHLAPAFLATMTPYLRELLGDGHAPDYRLAAEGAFQNWNWLEPAELQRLEAGAAASPFNVFDYPGTLERAMAANPATHLFIGTGLFDTLTTIGAVDHLLTHTELPADRVTTRSYAAGHMMYSDPECSSRLNDDLRTFIHDSLRR